MIRINFYLKADSKTHKQIRVYGSFAGRRYIQSTGISIAPDQWDKRKQKIKASAGIVGKHQNRILESIASAIEEKYWKVINKKKRLFTKAEFVKAVNKAAGLHQVEKKAKLTFIEYAEKSLNAKRDSKSITYNTGYSRQCHLNLVKEYHPDPFYFKDITPDWFMNFTKFLNEEKQYKQNTVSVIVASIKSYMNSALKEGLHKNLQYKHFSIGREKAINVYCTVEQLERLYNYKASSKALERTKDSFLINAFTGLRFNDGLNLSVDKIKETKGGRVFVMNTKKTKTRVNIPIHPLVEVILKKYGGKTPNVTLAQTNINLKKLFRQAGFNEPVYKAFTQGGKRIEAKYFFWELVGSHTARRSLATNLYLAGVKLKDIMSITGHTTISQLESYICVTGSESTATILKSKFYEGFKLRPA